MHKRQAYARVESVIHEPNHFCACVCLAFVLVLTALVWTRLKSSYIQVKFGSTSTSTTHTSRSFPQYQLQFPVVIKRLFILYRDCYNTIIKNITIIDTIIITIDAPTPLTSLPLITIAITITNTITIAIRLL